MPVYQYACTDCSEELEVRQSFTDDSLTTCPTCEGRLRKILSAVGVVFKGSGFYRNDSRAKSTDGDNDVSRSDSTSDAKSDSTGNSKTETKSDSKTETKETSSSSKSSDSKGSSGGDTKRTAAGTSTKNGTSPSDKSRTSR